MTGNKLRELFLNFFKDKQHHIIPSSSLIPHGDPTLLLNTAGMVQFKPYFLGEEKPPWPRLTSCQKCFRTTDIESVGDSSHCTFFEMLGNFSIGDYFKREAIAFAWEFVTRQLAIPEHKLWITIYKDDDEACKLWLETGVPPERIIRLGDEDNFWGPPGEAGPCGPCSEIHYDYGPDHGCQKPGCDPGCSCGRFVEIWNLVFIQFNQSKDGQRTPLSRPCIDTGMGLERISAVMQGTGTIFETDLLKPLISEVSRLAGTGYGKNESTDRAIRVVAEHSRGISFLVADGVMPGSDGRGYILRRLLRRAALYGRRLGFHEPFLYRIAAATIDLMKDIYPELVEKQQLILDITRMEETRFNETLTTGLELLDAFIAKAISHDRFLSGQDIFKLYDTFGFPVELTREIAQREDIEVDITGFEQEMNRQKERAKANQRFKAGRTVQEANQQLKASCFTGYEQLLTSSNITLVLQDGKTVPEITQGQQAALILEATPFYAEKGGQVGDTGVIGNQKGNFVVTDTLPGPMDSIIHHGYMEWGRLAVNQPVTAHVDDERRKDTARNHTATHLLHNSLRQILGPHAEQRGSMVSPDRLRFDFSHLQPVSAKELADIQSRVNLMIRSNLPVCCQTMYFKEAVEAGAIALFDEKYGDQVRVLKIGDPPVSIELCGGTHVSATGEIGLFIITAESSIGAGLRRIEAITGRTAEETINKHSQLIASTSSMLEVSSIDEIPQRIGHILDNNARLVKLIEDQQRQAVFQQARELISRAEKIGSVQLVSAFLPDIKIDLLRDTADYVKEKLSSGIVALASVNDEKPVFVVAVTGDLVKHGYKAGDIVREMSRITGGGGGGKPELATGGGRNASKLEEALASLKKMVAKDS